MQQLEMAGLAWGKRSQWSWTLSSPAGPVWVCLSEGLRRSDYGCSTNWWWFVSCCPGSTTHELSLVPSHQSCVFQLIGPRNSGLIAPDLQYRLLLLFIWSPEYVCTDSRCAYGCHVGIPRAGMWAQLPFCDKCRWQGLSNPHWDLYQSSHWLLWLEIRSRKQCLGMTFSSSVLSQSWCSPRYKTKENIQEKY